MFSLEKDNDLRHNHPIMRRLDLAVTTALVPLDYLVVLLAALAAYQLRFATVTTQIREVTFNLPFSQYLDVVLPAGVIFIIVFALSGLYVTRTTRIAVEVTRVFVAVSASMAAVLAVAFFSRELFDSRFIFLAAWVFAALFLMTERVIVRLFQRYLHRRGIGKRNAIVIGPKEHEDQLSRYFNSNHHSYSLLERFTSFNKVTKKTILQLKRTHGIDMLLIADPDLSKDQIQSAKTFSDIEHIPFFYSAELFPGAAVKPRLHTFAGQPVVEVPKTPLDGWGAIYKRGFDIVISLLLILLSLPLQIVVGIVLLLERQGGILFSQPRVGQEGQPFSYFKFRSMVANAHELRFNEEFLEENGNMRSETPLFKLKDDPRVTGFGAFMRKFSIDEIPEFYLVLLGRMSLVGPRPHLPEEINAYTDEQRRVLNIKPGITGISQVSGRANLAFNEENRLDLYYIENWTPWLDLVILLKTPFVVLLRKGAY